MERAQLEQHMAEETSAIQEMKRKPEAHYTEVVDTAWVECATGVKRLHDQSAKAEQQLRSLRQRHEKDPPREEEVVAVTTSLSTAEKFVMAVSLDSLDGKLPERTVDKRTAQEAFESKYHATTSVAKNRKSLADWLDISVEDILYERSELIKQLRSLSAIVDKLRAEKEDLQESLERATQRVDTFKKEPVANASNCTGVCTLERKVAVLEVRSYVEKGDEKQSGINISEGGNVSARGTRSQSSAGMSCFHCC
ncbi:hypothetical protein HPB51_014510 [Rhipicephalus microplus]|uniref:Uncharacterized protein n=1 Tax=Rhipicephalus microplus TaxID=6941 RepID=A0A9J6EH93_RHIMP|nr:hypothetical protein HPB51_014510 [Rhipicephalus microplus]